MADPIEYIQGAELPHIEVEWREASPDGGETPGALHDFSTGWTFKVRVGQAGAAAAFEKTTGIVGDDVAPNIVIEWATGELDLPPGEYRFDVIANFTATGQDLIRSGMFTILDAVLPPVP